MNIEPFTHQDFYTVNPGIMSSSAAIKRAAYILNSEFQDKPWTDAQRHRVAEVGFECSSATHGLICAHMNDLDINPAVYVFGSNEAGVHGAGAAKFAAQFRGAKFGCGVGHHGSSYAIPTKDKKIETLPLDMAKKYVDGFLEYASRLPQIRFYVTRIGCGLAGFSESQIAPLFATATLNCILPPGWRNRGE